MERVKTFFIQRSVIIGLLLILVIFPLVVNNPYIHRIMVLIGIYALLTSSLNLINGYTGMFSVGHSAFYGIGAYTSAILVMRLNVPIIFGLLAAGIMAALAGYLIARPTLRLKGIFLTLITLGFNIIVMLLIMNWNSLTRGPLGISGIPSPVIFGESIFMPRPYFYLVLLLNVIVLFILHRIVNSRFGRALKSIREDQDAAAANGVNVPYYKIAAFMIAAGIGGIAGSFYAHYMRYISPDSFDHIESFLILTMLVFGGTGNLVAPVAGTALLVMLTEAFRVFQDYRMIIYGVLLIGMMLFRRSGLLGGKEHSFMVQWPPKEKIRYGEGDRYLDDDELDEQDGADHADAEVSEKGNSPGNQDRLKQNNKESEKKEGKE